MTPSLFIIIMRTVGVGGEIWNIEFDKLTFQGFTERGSHTLSISIFHRGKSMLLNPNKPQYQILKGIEFLPQIQIF